MIKILILFSIIIGVAIIPYSFAEQIPTWVKEVAGWWTDRLISQDQFTDSLEYLINQGIIYIPIDKSISNTPEKIIPEWIHKTTQWWSNDIITDNEFINAMKYLIQNGIIQINTSTPEIIKEEEVKAKPLHMLLEGYSKAHADEEFILDVKIFDAAKYTGTTFGTFENIINGVKINIKLFNEEGEKIHDFENTTKHGMIRYVVMANETTQENKQWLKNNKYTVKILASLDGQTIEKYYEFIGDISKRHYPQTGDD